MTAVKRCLRGYWILGWVIPISVLAGCGNPPDPVVETLPDDMVEIPAGVFEMGCDPQQSFDCFDDAPPHPVALDTFWIDRAEVTAGAYSGCVADGACSEPLNTSRHCNWGKPDRTGHPINCLTSLQAAEYCDWAGRRLPTEAEWERAARGDGRTYPWGDDPPTCNHANYDGCGDGTMPVGSYPSGASAEGVLDLAGNVWEWTADWYAEDTYAHHAELNPIGAAPGLMRVVRGGGFFHHTDMLRSTRRDRVCTTFADQDVGFRCAKSPRADVGPTIPPADTEILLACAQTAGDGQGTRGPAVVGDMVEVPAGAFWRGCVDGDEACNDDEHPGREVTLVAYRIDVTEVTSAAYRDCVDAGACSAPLLETASARNPDAPAPLSCNWGDDARDDHPMNCVNWAQAEAYCRWVGKRLPTEAEWERAARGEAGAPFPWGDAELTCDRANYQPCTGDTTPVGSLPDGASPLGVQDLAGNVWEWVADWYDDRYYETGPTADPKGAESGFLRSVRGGSLHDPPSKMRMSHRDYECPCFSEADIGFRCAGD